MWGFKNDDDHDDDGDDKNFGFKSLIFDKSKILYTKLDSKCVNCG
jgi:hypothetical protein